MLSHVLKDDFQSLLRSLRTLMLINIITAHSMECESMLFVRNHIPYLWDLSNSFSNRFIDFYSCESFHQAIYQKEWSIKLCIDNGGWHETLNLLHDSRCEMLQTLESAQYWLEISFNIMLITIKKMPGFPFNYFTCIVIKNPHEGRAI